VRRAAIALVSGLLGLVLGAGGVRLVQALIPDVAPSDIGASAPGDGAPAGKVAEGLDEAVALAEQEVARLEAQVKRADDRRVQDLIEQILDPAVKLEDRELVARMRDGDDRIRLALEERADRATRPQARAATRALLFLGTGDPAQLDRVFDDVAAEGGSFTRVISGLNYSPQISTEARAQVATRVARLSRQDAAKGIDLLRYGALGGDQVLERDRFADRADHDRLVALSLDCAFAGDGDPGCLRSLVVFSPEAAVSAAATLAADPRRSPAVRAEAVDALQLNRKLLRRSLGPWFDGLPEGDSLAEWRAWLEANGSRVERVLSEVR